MGKIKAYIEAMRPKHWVKNLLIFAPLFFAHEFFSAENFLQGVYLFLAFCSLASSIYIVNDLNDRKQDRLHPRKKFRSIASGTVSANGAIILMIILIIIAIGLSFLFPIRTIVAMIVYFLANVLYSFRLKHVPIVDIFLVASMYLVRLYAGGNLWNIHLSSWIILCTFFLALFLISAKRRAEFNTLGGEESQTRKVMQFYNKEFLDHMVTISTTACLVTYSLYLVSVDKPYLLYSFFFVAFGIIRYLYLIYRYNVGQRPESIVVTDIWIVFTIIGWLIYNTYVFYFF